MCLKPEVVPPVPELTVLVARAAFPKGNRYIRLRDVFDRIFEDDQFHHLYPPQGQPG